MTLPRHPRARRLRLAAVLLTLALPALAQNGPVEPAWWGAAATVRLEHALAAEVAESLNGRFTNQTVRLAEVRADETDNSVVIFAWDRHDLDTMREMGAALDVAPPLFLFETAVFAIGSATNRETAAEWFSRADGRDTPVAPPDDVRCRWVATTARSRDDFLSVARSNLNARISGCPIVCAQGEREAIVEMSDTQRFPDGSVQAWGFRLALTPRARKDGCVSLGAKARFLPNNNPEDPFDSSKIDVLLKPGETLACGGFPRDDGTDRLVLIRLRPDPATPSPEEFEPRTKSAKFAK